MKQAKQRYIKISVLVFCASIYFVYCKYESKDKQPSDRRIFCFILTKYDNFNNQTKAVNRTWAQDCDRYVFVAKLKSYDLNFPTEIYDENYYPLLQLPHYIESYAQLTEKVFEAFKYIYENYGDFGWFVKADDDTFMLIDNLRTFLSDKDPSKALTYGCVLHVEEIESGYLQGGAGYVLSNHALKAIAEKLITQPNACLSSGREDTDVATCFRKLKIYSSKSSDEESRERFHPFNLQTILKGKYPPWYYGHIKNDAKKGIEVFSDTTISLHDMPPKAITKLYNVWTAMKKQYGNTSLKFKDLVVQYFKVA